MVKEEKHGDFNSDMLHKPTVTLNTGNNYEESFVAVD